MVIEFESLKSICSKLHKLNQLRSLSLGAMIIRYQDENQIYDINLLLSKIYSSPDLFDGDRWQTLITLNFKFDGMDFQIENTLDTFRTSFWLEKKCWFVAYQD